MRDRARHRPHTAAQRADSSVSRGTGGSLSGSFTTRILDDDVLEVRRIDDADFAKLGVLGKLKSLAHGRKTAYTPRASACEGCGKCVEACPEKAIKLVRASQRDPA